jgi:hypothetical protein
MPAILVDNPDYRGPDSAPVPRYPRQGQRGNRNQFATRREGWPKELIKRVEAPGGAVVTRESNTLPVFYKQRPGDPEPFVNPNTPYHHRISMQLAKKLPNNAN